MPHTDLGDLTVALPGTNRAGAHKGLEPGKAGVRCDNSNRASLRAGRFAGLAGPIERRETN